MNWTFISKQADRLNEAVLREDRIEVINSMFSICSDMLGNDQVGILCDNQKEADTLADLWDSLYETQTCVTGTFEEVRGQIDSLDGKAYVDVV